MRGERTPNHGKVHCFGLLHFTSEYGQAGRKEPRVRVSVAWGYSKAIEYHVQDMAIAKEVCDRAGEGWAYANLGTVHMHLNEYDKSVAYR